MRPTLLPTSRITEGIDRLKDNWPYVLQVGLASGLAFWVGLLIGHEHPFFAPMSVVIVLSTTGGERFRRSIELVVGVSVGVGLGDLIVASVGTGVWQIALGVMSAVAVGIFIDKGPLLANQAAFASVLVATILPPSTSGGFDRMTDALIGGIVGLVVLALFPISPLRSGRREISHMLGIAAGILDQVAKALPRYDAASISAALATARGTQAGINKMIAAAQESKEAARFSPFLWAQRSRIASMLRILNPVDNTIRSTRVLARQALILAEAQGRTSEEQVQMIAELSQIAETLAHAYAGHEAEHLVIPKLVKQLQGLAVRAQPEILATQVLTQQALLVQTRSLIVDMLQICGMSRKSAAAALAPVT